MNEKERIDFIKQEWKKFLKKKLKKDIDISKIESIEEIKRAITTRDAIEKLAEEYEVEATKEQLILLADKINEEKIIEKRESEKIKERNSIEGSFQFFSHRAGVDTMINTRPFEILVKESIRSGENAEYYNHDDNCETKEAKVDIINNNLEKQYDPHFYYYSDTIAEKNGKNFTIKGYHLIDIVSKGIK